MGCSLLQLTTNQASGTAAINKCRSVYDDDYAFTIDTHKPLNSGDWTAKKVNINSPSPQ